MNLHEDRALFRQAVAATAQRMNIPDIYIEKDYRRCNSSQTPSERRSLPE